MTTASTPTTIFEVQPELYSSGQGLPNVPAGGTVIAISTDGQNFTSVPDNGDFSVVVNGTYLGFSADAGGDLYATDSQGGSTNTTAQGLIDAINEQDGTSPPISDTIYYQVQASDGTVSTEAYRFDLGDTGFTAPQAPPYSSPETITPGTTIDIGGATVTKALSSDGTYGEADPSSYVLTASIGAFDFTNQAADGTIAIDPTVQGGGGTISYGADDGSVTITGTLDQINADLSTLTYTAVAVGTDAIIISDVDSPTPSANQIIGQVEVSDTPGNPAPVDQSTSTIFEVTPSTGASEQGLPFLSASDTVYGISADGQNFTSVPQDGSSADVSGTFLQFSVDASGDVVTTLAQGNNQDVIDQVNADDGGSAPLDNSLYYEVQHSDGSASVYQYSFDLGDDGFIIPSTPPYSSPETISVGTTIDIGGAGVTKALSTDGTYAEADPSTYNLTANVSLLDFSRQAADGTVAIDPVVQGGGGTISYGADHGSVTITGTISQINMDLSTLTYTAVNTGADFIILSESDSPTPNANQIIGQVDVEPAATCFCPGTLILTSVGEVPVELLEIGHEVVTADGTTEPVKWIGWRHYDRAFVAGNHLMLPVRIVAGALGHGIPRQDLTVSPGHGMVVEGCLVPAWRLVNGRTIIQAVTVETVSYFHVELERHAILLANGALAESFLDHGERAQFHNATDFRARYGKVAPVTPWAARTEDGFALQRVQEHIADLAGLRPALEPAGPLRGFVDVATLERVAGWAQDADSPEEPVALEVSVGDTPVLCLLANAYRGDLRRAGFGSGCHAFAAQLPAGYIGAVVIRRVVDGASLALTEAAMALAA